MAKNSGNGIARFWAIFMTLVLVAGIVAGVVFWKKNYIEFNFPKAETEADKGVGAVIGEIEEDGVAVAYALIAPEDYEEYGVSDQAAKAYELTATVHPETAANKLVDWSAAWENASSEWASGKTVTDYVTITPTSDGAMTAVAEYLQPFGETVKITITSREYSAAKATVDIECAMTPGMMTLSIGGYTYELDTYDNEFDVTIDEIDLNRSLTQNSDQVTSVTIAADEETPYTVEDEWTYSVTMHQGDMRKTENGKSIVLYPNNSLVQEQGVDVLEEIVSFDINFFQSYFTIMEPATHSPQPEFTDPEDDREMIGLLNTMEGVFLTLNVTVEGEYNGTGEFTVNIHVGAFKNTSLVTSVTASDTVVVF